MSNKKLSNKEIVEESKKVIHSEVNQLSTLMAVLSEMEGFSQDVLGNLSDEDREKLEKDFDKAKKLCRSFAENYQRMHALLMEGKEEFFTKRQSVYDLVDEAFTNFKYLRKDSGIKLIPDYDFLKGVELMTSDVAVSRILYNFLENARVHSGSDKIVLGAKPSDEGVEVYVQDFGKGLAEGIQEKIFEGHRVESEGKGIGLSYNKELSEKIGARVAVSSSPGKGCVFSLYLKES